MRIILNLLDLDFTQFENLTLDIMNELGLKNSVWRTPGGDVGRDIQGEYFFTDLSGYFQMQKWYIECKRHAGSIDWPTIWKKIAYAQNHNCDVLLFSTTSSLTPQACDQITLWNTNRNKPIIRFWTNNDVASKLNEFPWVAQKYGLLKSPSEISGNILLPANKLLLKLSNSLGFDKDRIRVEKIELIQSLSELISIRLEELVSFGNYKFSLFNEDYDYIDWFVGNNCKLVIFDASSIRAFLHYLKMVFSIEKMSFSLENSVLTIKIDSNIKEAIEEHLKIISGLSNFIINFQKDCIKVARICKN